MEISTTKVAQTYAPNATPTVQSVLLLRQTVLFVLLAMSTSQLTRRAQPIVQHSTTLTPQQTNVNHVMRPVKSVLTSRVPANTVQSTTFYGIQYAMPPAQPPLFKMLSTEHAKTVPSGVLV